MPYVYQTFRQTLDPKVKALADEIKLLARNNDPKTFWAGLFNYSVTTLLLQLLPERKYWVTAMVKGIYHDLADEFTRRYQTPYEDEQCQKNGDLPWV